MITSPTSPLLLISTATEMECRPLQDWLCSQYTHAEIRVEMRVTGVGILNASYSLFKAILQLRPVAVWQAGIAGLGNSHTFSPDLCFLSCSDFVADAGVLEEGRWKSYADLGLERADDFPLTAGRMNNPLAPAWQSLFKTDILDAITVSQMGNTAFTTGGEPYTESLEGAALHKICLEENIPFAQIRTVSNLAGERRKTEWRLTESIRTLNRVLIDTLANPEFPSLFQKIIHSLPAHTH